MADDALPAPVRTGRLAYVDAARGLCILSMLTLHLAEPSLLSEGTHQLLVLDGAHGFVTLAGFVLGIVERRRVAKGLPLSETRRAALRRIGLLLVGHWAVVIGIVLINAATRRSSLLSEAFVRQSVARQLWDVVTFRLMPDNVNILPMYVIFLALTGFVYAPLLRSGRTWAVAAISAGLYVLSHLVHDWRWMLSPFAALAWQALFTAGLIVGWHVNQATALRRAWRPWPVVTATAAVVLCAGLARHFVQDRLSESVRQQVYGLVGKFHLGLFNLLGGLGLVLLLCLFVAKVEVSGWLSGVVRWLALLGRRSLACYLAISVLAFFSHLLPSSWREHGRGDLVVIAAVVLTWLVAVWRDRNDALFSRYKRNAPSAASASAALG